MSEINLDIEGSRWVRKQIKVPGEEVMLYDDFEIEIGPITDEGYVLSVKSREGDTHDTFRLPFDNQALDNALLAVENAVLRSVSVGRWIGTDTDAKVREFGRRLFEAVFHPAVRALFDRTRRTAERDGRGTRIKLRIVSPELSVLPWELLYNPDRDEYFCRLRDTPIVRYVECDNPLTPLTVQPPLRILGLATSPRGCPQLDIEQEKARVEGALEGLRSGQRVDLVWTEGGSWRELQARLREGRWHVFHFIGHGGFDLQSETGLLFLEGDRGEAYPIDSAGLGDLLCPHKSLRFVLLNCCESARTSRQNIFSSTATTLVRRGVPAVLAMQYRISDKAAVEFARSFYTALADRTPVDASVADARLAIKLALPDSVEWVTPVLFTHSADGSLFTGAGSPPASGPNHEIVRDGPEDESRLVDISDEVPVIESQSIEIRPHPVKWRPHSQRPPDDSPGTAPVEWHGRDVPVHLIISIADPGILNRVTGLRKRLTEDKQVFESKQSFRFIWKEVEPSNLVMLLRQMAEADSTGLIVVVSDVLVNCGRGGPDDPVPSPTTAAIRSLFLDQPRPCGLVALFASSRQRAQDIESIVSPTNLTNSLASAVVATADAWRLKAPPGPPIDLKDGEAIVVRLARSKHDMRACLRLRFQVYDRLGYLEERISRCPAKLDLDCYDNRAIQFLAESNQTGIVGTARLLLPQPLPLDRSTSVIGSPPWKTLEFQAGLCRRIADAEERAGNAALAQKLSEHNFAPLPILQSNDFREKTPQILIGAKSQVELSRLVVWPYYRGLGVSRLLIRAVLAVAHDLRRDMVLLDCVPLQVPMYRKYGFERIHEHHGRVRDLDQVAVAMYLELTSSPLDHAASVANRDLDMIRSGPNKCTMLLGRRHHLCLCDQKGCWSEGAYSSKTQDCCPLGDLHRMALMHERRY